MIVHAIEAARRAGKVIMEEYAHGAGVRVKENGTPVTTADTRSHTVIVECLRATQIPIMSEESDLLPEKISPERVWIVDPLDGTKDFIDRTSDFSVMIALVERGVVTVSVVFAPAHDILYRAERGRGAFVCDAAGERRCVVSARPPEGGRFVASAHHFSPLMQLVGESLNSSTTRRGSNGVKGGLIAEGDAEYMFNEADLPVWDIAPVDLIVSEAGGKVTDMEGKVFSYQCLDRTSGIVISNNVAHMALVGSISHLRGTLET